MSVFFRDYNKIRRSSKEIEPQEVLLDNLAKKKEKNLDIDSQILETELSRKIIKIAKALILFSVILLLGFTFKLQVIEGKKFSLLAKNNFEKTIFIQPERGVIYDRNKKQLVFNKIVFDLVCDKDYLPKNEKERMAVLEKAAKVFNIPLSEIKGKVSQDAEPEVVITQQANSQIIAFLKANPTKLPGFALRERGVREYIDGEILSHIIGYLGVINKKELSECKNYDPLDYVGKSGLEKYYEKDLRGQPGIKKIDRDAFLKKISERGVQSPIPGSSLLLNIDYDLQKELYSELEKELEELGVKKGAGIAIDPRNGKVLALVSLPTFDNNDFSRGMPSDVYKKLENDPNKPFFNRVVSGTYPTGSTIKPLIASAALEEGIISTFTKLYCPLHLCLKNIYTGEKKCYSDWKFHGWTDVKKAIAESVNPFFYIIGGGYKKPDFADSRLPQKFEGLGVERIKKYLQFFGWGGKTNIDIPGEATGRIPDPSWKKNYFEMPQDKEWHIGDTYNLSIGQGYLAVTPLQVATAFQAIANGGTIYKPEIVGAFLDKNGNLVKKISPQILDKDFIKKENINIVREGMREAVISGSSTLLSSLPVKVAAKTGTAQIPRKGYYDNWVTVFAPYDKPEIVLTIVIEDVKGMKLASLPVAKNVLEWYFSLDNNK